MPAVSVIIPVYNVENYIKRCIESLIRQSYDDFELILVDDGSTDRSGFICDGFAELDDRIVVLHRCNGGLSAARNSGIDWVFQNSKSEYITFIDSDDWVEGSYLKVLLGLIDIEPNIGISMCSFRRNPIVDCSEEYKQGITCFSEYYDIHGLPHVNAWGKLIRKSLFYKIRFPEGRLFEDLFIMHEVLAQTKKIAYTYAPLYIYELNNEGISNSSWNMKKLDEVEACESFLKYMKMNRNPSGVRYGKVYYCTVLERQIRGMREHIQTDTREDVILLRKLRGALISSIPYQSINDVSWFYQLAFPKFSFIYWSVKGFLNKG